MILTVMKFWNSNQVRKNEPLLKNEPNSFTKREVMLVAEEVSVPLVFQDNPMDICCLIKEPSRTEREALQLALFPPAPQTTHETRFPQVLSSN